MSLEKVDNNIKWYSFHHNESYQLLQQHFWLYQKQIDHESIMVYFKFNFYNDQIVHGYS